MQRPRVRRGKLRAQRGSAIVEFTLSAIPLVFALTSIVSIGLAMWNAHTLAEAVKYTAREASTHGAGCVGKTCAWTVGTAASMLATHAIGIPAGSLNVTFTSAGGTSTCTPITNCTSSSTAWPTSASSQAGTTDITVAATYTPLTFIRMFSPGQTPTAFSKFNLAATSTQMVVY